MVPPGLFIPLAEETGAIGPIDEWVLRQACREAASWQKPLSIAVNLSPVDFRRGDVPAMILSILLETGLDPKRLEIEITEGVLFEDFDRALSILRRIKSSRRPHRDGRFRHRLFVAVLSAVVSIRQDQDRPELHRKDRHRASRPPPSSTPPWGSAARSRLPVIAEGVETEEQRAFLANAGCGIQGYLIGRPEPIAHYQHLVTAMAAKREGAVIAG